MVRDLYSYYHEFLQPCKENICNSFLQMKQLRFRDLKKFAGIQLT